MNRRDYNDPEHWHQRAAEARELADKITDPEGKKGMLEIAEKYEHLASRAVERVCAQLHDPDPSPPTSRSPQRPRLG
jgi:hypothetical protein